MQRGLKTFRIMESGFQRNGIAGEGFHYFKIQWRDFGEGMNILHEGIATLTVECDQESDRPEKFNGSCRVVTPDDLSQHWRGDIFEEEIRKHIKEWWKY